MSCATAAAWCLVPAVRCPGSVDAPGAGRRCAPRLGGGAHQMHLLRDPLLSLSTCKHQGKMSGFVGEQERRQQRGCCAEPGRREPALCRSRSSSAQWGQTLGRVVQGTLAKLPRITAGRHVSETHASGFYEGSVHNAFVKAKQIRSNFNLATIDFFFQTTYRTGLKFNLATQLAD